MAFNNIYIFLMKKYLLGEVRILTKLKIHVLFQLHFFSFSELLQQKMHDIFTSRLVVFSLKPTNKDFTYV